MTISLKPLPLVWRPVLLGRDTDNPDVAASTQVMSRIDEVIRKWKGTKYASGQQAAGTGVDCVRFVCAVLDELIGQERIQIERRPADTAMHNKGKALGAMRELLRAYPEMQPVAPDDHTAEPGDVLVVGHEDGGPGHCLIVGARRNTLWHASAPEVWYTGWALDINWQTPKALYRFANKRRWLHGS